MKHLLAFFMALSLLLASAPLTHAGPGRPGFSSRPSSGGFRSSSSPSYRSFSPSPSRTYTFRSTPSYKAPAAPRYTAPRAAAPSTSRSTYRSSKKTVVNNHYHGGSTASGGGGLSLMDYVILDNLTSRDRGPAYVSQGPAVQHQQPVAYTDGVATSVVYQEESHFWGNTFLILGVAAIVYGVYRFLR